MDIEKKPFGKTLEGEEVQVYTLINENGMSASITTYGGIVTSLLVPDKDRKLANVVLGFNHLDGYLSEAYLKNQPYFGALIGRYGNRIAGGTFKLNDQEYTLATNNGPNHLHGGRKGFDKVVWAAKEMPERNTLQFSYTSPAGEEGYPGTLQVTVTYTLSTQNELIIDYQATTDQATPVNLTQHSYFNLTGGQEDVLGHELLLHADYYTAVDQNLIPTGELAPVAGTPLDFREPHLIGERIQQMPGGGYDHNYVLNDADGTLKLAATVYEKTSGRTMEVFTTEPGLQFYSGNFLKGEITNDKGQPIQNHAGFCLEAQHYPDSPNQPSFPSTILQPGEVYQQRTIYKFSAKR
ncbi:aldose epimerase family protein [Rufibacter soli]